MFKAVRCSLIAIAVVGIACAPSAAHASSELNPSPRGVAIGLSETANALRCPRVGTCASPYRAVTHGSAGRSVTPPAASSQQPFQWGDAGIGAGAMLVLLSVIAVAAVVGTRRQRHRVTAT